MHQGRQLYLTAFVVAFFVAVMRKATATLASTGASATCAIGAKSSASAAAILSRQPLGHGPLDTPDPFLFCVYHNDNYPAGDKDMQAPKRGNGADFNPNAPYRMYHGDRVPGFPQHPHRGFETITATITGLIDHTDSLGNAGRYGDGDLCWMTAGSGVVHGEMFPLIHNDRPNPLRFFQIWLNLPQKSKMSAPGFVMHWASEIPKWSSDDGLAQVTVWAGEFKGKTPGSTPPASWAAQQDSDVSVWHITLAAGGNVTLPPAAGGVSSNRALYFIEGDELQVMPDDVTITTKSYITVDGSQAIQLSNPSSRRREVEVLVLQGRPIGEPVAKHGPFVMNTRQEIEQAFRDYRATRFGGWPWPKDAMVFPRSKGRFALLNGKETIPPK